MGDSYWFMPKGAGLIALSTGPGERETFKLFYSISKAVLWLGPFDKNNILGNIFGQDLNPQPLSPE